jgi:hypothetical protein
MKRRPRAFYDSPGVRRKAMLREQRAAKDSAPSNNGQQPPEQPPESQKKETRWSVLPFLLLATLPLAAGLAIVRAIGLVKWPWAIVLAPLTAAGAAFLAAYMLNHYANRVPLIRKMLYGALDTATITPPPEQLEPPLAAEDIGDGILAHHPELLAALCLGFRRMKFVPAVLGTSVDDAWGVYASALTASSLELKHLKAVARLHTQAYAKSRAAKYRKEFSDSELMHMAVNHFRGCADKINKRGQHPDCPYEHVVVIFGSNATGRDTQLAAVAPRVKSLIEKQYPQIRTASLSDGSVVKFSEWQKAAAERQKELAHERKEHERAKRKVNETLAELDGIRSKMEEMRASVDDAREQARRQARADAAAVVDELRATLERVQQEYARQVQRLNGDLEKNAALIESLSAERDALERALFSATEEEVAGPEVDGQALAGLRILVVGGDDRQARPVRDYLESRGVQMLHEDSVNAVQLVASVDIVVFWIRYLSHPKYFAVRRECRVKGVQHGYWMRTSPAGLASLLAAARQSGTTFTG